MSLFLTVALGGMVGSAILLAFGRPDTRPRPSAVTVALRRSGLDLVALEPAKVDARGSTPFFGRLADGGGIFAKVLGADQRSADLLFRLYRFVRLKNVGDERPFSSLRRTVEHEALVSLQARDVGVRTPRMRAIAATDGDALLLAYDLIGGRSLDAVDPATIDDQLLGDLWEQVSVLRRHRIAHRDLRRANVIVDEGGEPWVIDFGFAEVAASDALLDADVAQLLAATDAGRRPGAGRRHRRRRARPWAGGRRHSPPPAQRAERRHPQRLQGPPRPARRAAGDRGPPGRGGPAAARAHRPLQRPHPVHGGHAGGGHLLPAAPVRRSARHRRADEAGQLGVGAGGGGLFGHHLRRRSDRR